MTIDISNGYKKIIADTDYFLTNGTIWGTAIVLGVSDSEDNYQELPLSEMPVIDITEDSSSSDESIIDEIIEEETDEISDEEALKIILGL